MTTVVNSRHDRHIRLRMVEPVPGDQARDMLGKRSLVDYKDHPMIEKRYRVYPQGGAAASTTTGPNTTLPPTTAGVFSANRTTPITVTGPQDSSMNDLHILMGGRPLKDDIAEQLRLNFSPRFDPRFIELDSEDETFLDDAIRLVQGGDGQEPVFSTHLWQLNSNSNENSCTSSLVAALNEIADTILQSWRVKNAKPAQAYRPFFSIGCDLAVKPNPGFDPVPGHGEERFQKFQKSVRPSSAWNNVKPDIIVWKDPAHPTERHWGNLASMCEVKKASLGDMNTGQNNEDASLLQLAKYLLFLAYENPITGRTSGLSACNGLIRLTISDSLSMSTSRVCDIRNPEHARELVLMIALLIGPLDAVIDTFSPPEDRFTIKGSNGAPSVEYEWVPPPPLGNIKKRKRDGLDLSQPKASKTANPQSLKPVATGTKSSAEAQSIDAHNSGVPEAGPTSYPSQPGSSSTRSDSPPVSKPLDRFTTATDKDDFFSSRSTSSKAQPISGRGTNHGIQSDSASHPSASQRKWRILERRRDLHGRRTITIAGMARPIGSSDPPEPLVLKFTWLPLYLSQHELRMLQHLKSFSQRIEAGSTDLNPPEAKLKEAMEKVGLKIAHSCPVALGMLAGCHRETRELPPTFAGEDGFQPGTSPSHVTLVLTAMCTRNEPGKRIDETTKLSMQQRGRILLGTVGSLWLAACSEIHYRDINNGNIIFWEDDGGEVHGFLIDYGNARRLDERRLNTKLETLPESGASDSLDDGVESLQKLLDDIQLRLDDARSGNVYFLSIAVMKISAALADLQTELSHLRERRRELDADPDNGQLREALTSLEEQIKARNEEIAKLSVHRYIDDIESDLYAHIFQVLAAAGKPVRHINGEVVRFKHSIDKFNEANIKEESWNKSLVPTLNAIDVLDNAWNSCIREMATCVRETRQKPPQGNDYDPRLTDVEHECFKTCVDILVKYIPLMSTKIVAASIPRIPQPKFQAKPPVHSEPTGGRFT